jgi:hypothetical protein
VYNNTSSTIHPSEPNTTQIKLHHSRHPSDNLCGVRLEDGRRIEQKKIDGKGEEIDDGI